MAQGWTVVPEPKTPATPPGWTPVARPAPAAPPRRSMRTILDELRPSLERLQQLPAGPDQDALLAQLAPQLEEYRQARDAPAPTFTSTNQKDATGAAVVDPNTVGTFVRHVGAQVDPRTLVQTIGAAITAPRETLQAIGAAQGALYDRAKAAYDRGDYPSAARHFVNYLLPLVGPGLDRSSDALEAGQWAAGTGDAVGLGLATFGPKALANVGAARYPLAAHPAARRAPPPPQLGQFAAAHDIPLDAATVSDNWAVKGTQALVDRSLGGAMVATPARARQAAAMTRAGETLAGRAHPVLVTPEQGGTAVRGALAAEARAQATTADTAYDLIRTREADPTNRLVMPGKPTPVQGLTADTQGQLRRMVHELDAAPYTPRLLQPGKYGSSMEHVEGTGGAGAAVFDDIVQRAGSHATRGTVQSQLEAYLGGGPETPLVKAALEVAGERNAARGGYAVSKPELPPSAMDVPTRLEGRVTGEEMGFPVNVKAAKPAIQAVVAQMKRQLPVTQQQASPGLKALENILDGPDYGSLSQIDRDLSAIKALARQGSPLAKFAVTKLEAAVSEAAAAGGPEIVEALGRGRAATIAKYTVTEALDALHTEPVRVVKALTAPKDSAIVQLRGVLRQVPAQAPVLARAYLEDLLASPQKVAEWRKLGPETRRALFPQAGQVEALDQFFTLTDRISKANVNPSGSGYAAWLTTQGMQLLYDPVTGVPVQIGAAALAKLLRSPAAIRALTQGVTLPRTAPAAVRTAVTLRLVQTAKDAGVSLALPQAADRSPGGSPP